MTDVDKRLAEIRERRAAADAHWDQTGSFGPAGSVLLDGDVPWLLALVDRLRAFVPVPIVQGDEVSVSPQLPSMADDATVMQAMLTACEVHGIEPPAWLTARAHSAGTEPPS